MNRRTQNIGALSRRRLFVRKSRTVNKRPHVITCRGAGIPLGIVLGLLCCGLVSLGREASGMQSEEAILTSQDWSERARAANTLLALLGSEGQQDAISSLLDLLELETAIVNDSFRGGVGVSDELGEAYVEYYARLQSNLLEAADFAEPRVIEVMARSSYNPDSALAERLAESSGLGLVPVAVELARSDSTPTRWNGVALCGMLYERRDEHDFDETTAGGLKTVLRAAANDTAAFLLLPAPRALAIRLAAGPLAGTDAGIGTIPAAADRAGSLTGVRHGDPMITAPPDRPVRSIGGMGQFW